MSKAWRTSCRDEGQQLGGWEGVMAGDVPIGAGLSSSAALELATARAFAAVSDLPWDPKQMARFSQRAENEWVGMNCGIMDQMISAMGAADHALLIDCRTARHRVRTPPPRHKCDHPRHGHAARPGGFRLQRAPPAVRSSCGLFWRARPARRRRRNLRCRRGRAGRPDPPARPACDHRKRAHTAGCRGHARRRCRCPWAH